MNKASVEARKEDLQRQREQLVANINAVVGALQDCDYWLSVIEEEERQAANVTVQPPSVPVDPSPAV